MSGHLKFANEVPKKSAPNGIALNRTMQGQTKASIAISREVCALLRYYAAQSSNSTPFQANLSVLASRVKKSKRENRA